MMEYVSFSPIVWRRLKRTRNGPIEKGKRNGNGNGPNGEKTEMPCLVTFRYRLLF